MGYSFYTYFISIFVAFGGFLFGYDTSNIAGVMGMKAFILVFGHRQENDHHCGSVTQVDENTYYCISSVNKSLITSLLSIGTLLGAFSGAWVADNLGRKGGVIFSAAIFTAGAAIQTGVENVGGMIAGRIVAGAGVGLLSMLVPMYQAEACPPAVRGALVSFYQFAITCGILLAQGLDLGTEHMSTSASWRIPIGLQILWGLILIFGVLFIPESPRYLVHKGRIDDARMNLARMRSLPADSEGVRAEMAEIQNNYDYELSLGKPTYAECFRGNLRKRTFCGIWVQMFQQLTGVNFIFYFGTTFFQNAGISKPYLITVITGVVNVVMTLPGIWMVERLGRRRFLLGGAAWMSLCQLIVGVTAVASPNSDSSHKVLVAFTCLFIAGFASTWGPGAWVLISELYPLKVRGKAMSLATASNWWWNWVIAFVVPYITDAGYGNLQSKIAFIWFGTSLCACIWTYFYVPETRGWSLEELDEMFEQGVPYRKTPQWTPSTNWQSGVHQAAPESKYNLDDAQSASATSEKAGSEV